VTEVAGAALGAFSQIAMITDWIVHPFRHLQGGDMSMHHEMGGVAAADSPASGDKARRLIFLQLDSPPSLNARAVVFGITTARVPLFFADVDMHSLTLADIQDLAHLIHQGGVFEAGERGIKV
jgi:hypothetical protein